MKQFLYMIHHVGFLTYSNFFDTFFLCLAWRTFRQSIQDSLNPLFIHKISNFIFIVISFEKSLAQQKEPAQEHQGVSHSLLLGKPSSESWSLV